MEKERKIVENFTEMLIIDYIQDRFSSCSLNVFSDVYGDHPGHSCSRKSSCLVKNTFVSFQML